ncbi:MAG: hypothetical protein JRJ02_07985 [Deltaproteobacteria bacterium]|nr:hypothetical protein [Deltaproteobacteria bacterium]MBW1862299.1 hypothetical protein [Deltaproteobacteria bacterium]
MKEIIIGLKGRVGLFQKSRIKNFHLLVERPLTRTIKHRTGREGIFRSSAFLWGCSVMNFKATLPFHRAGHGYADLLKETYTALPALFSKH